LQRKYELTKTNPGRQKFWSWCWRYALAYVFLQYKTRETSRQVSSNHF
jgi:hypothetical protein